MLRYGAVSTLVAAGGTIKDPATETKTILNSSTGILTGLAGTPKNASKAELKETKPKNDKIKIDDGYVLCATDPRQLRNNETKLKTADEVVKQSGMKDWLTIPIWCEKYVDNEWAFEEVYSLMMNFKTSGAEAIADKILLESENVKLSNELYRLLNGMPNERDNFYALIRRLFKMEPESEIEISEIVNTILNLAMIRQAREFERRTTSVALVDLEVVGKGVFSQETIPENVCVFVYTSRVCKLSDYLKEGLNTYLIIKPPYIHDARYSGGMARFVNCFPKNAPDGAVSENVKFQTCYLGKKGFSLFITTKQIEVGDQFGCDYSDVGDEFEFGQKKLGYFNNEGDFFATKDALSKAIAEKTAAATSGSPQLRA